jgi:hypothetical protein
VCIGQGERLDWAISMANDSHSHSQRSGDSLMLSIVFRPCPEPEPQPEPEPEATAGQRVAAAAAAAAAAGASGGAINSRVVLAPVLLEAEAADQKSGVFEANDGHGGVLTLVLDNTASWTRGKTVNLTLRSTLRLYT